eukprot:3451763-Prymnesium_polylepis.1
MEAVALSDDDEDEDAAPAGSLGEEEADCAEDIAAAVEVTSPADAIKVLTAAIPDWWGRRRGA